MLLALYEVFSLSTFWRTIDCSLKYILEKKNSEHYNCGLWSELNGNWKYNLRLQWFVYFIFFFTFWEFNVGNFDHIQSPPQIISHPCQYSHSPSFMPLYILTHQVQFSLFIFSWIYSLLLAIIKKTTIPLQQQSITNNSSQGRMGLHG